MLILDRDPRECARNTPAALIKSTLRTLHAVAQEVTNDNNDFKEGTAEAIVLHSIKSGMTTAQWYSDYLGELLICDERAFNNPWFHKFSIEPAEVIYSPYVTSDFIPHLHNPCYIDDYKEFLPEKFPTDPVIASRLILAKMNPTYDEFHFGIPKWFIELSDKIYDSYDPQTGKHVVIRRAGDRYKYFTSFISDNFKEVENVPKEIDSIIDMLLTKDIYITDK